MERRLKERLIGAAVLVMLAVIFIPMILDNSVEPDTSIDGTNIPPRPESEFSSRVVPLTEPDLALEKVPDEVEIIKEEVGELVDEAPVAEQAPVQVESAPTPQEQVKQPLVVASETEPESMGVTAWVVQIGSFSSESNARGLNEKLRKQNYSSFVEPLRQESGKIIYRVRVGPELLRSDAQALKKKLDAILKKDGVEGMVVRYP